MPQRVTCKVFAFTLGAASLGLQVLLLRQFMTVFYGNELVIGFTLSIWLLWVGAGSAVGHMWWKQRTPATSHFSNLLLFTLLFSFLIIVAIKNVRVFFDVPYGEFLSFAQIFIFAVLALFVPAVLSGFLFALLARLFRVTVGEQESAAIVYAYEAIGTVGAGLLFTFLPAIWFGLESFFLLGVFVFGVLFLVTRSKVLLASVAVFLILLCSSLPQKIETLLLKKYWQHVDSSFHLVDWRYTRFGQSSIIEWGGEKFLYFNGTKVSSLKNEIDSQALAATLLVQHPDPRNILLIEGNAGNLAIECARFDVFVDVMELDGDMFRFAQLHMEPEQQEAWSSEKIKIHVIDARRALKKSDKLWDMIVVNVGAPTTALSNRYYTGTFFQRVKSSLTHDGVLVLCHFPAGENFLGDELLSLNRILWNTVNSQFSNVLALPGDNAIYFASESPRSLDTSSAVLDQRYNARNPQFNFFDKSMFSYIYQKDRIDDFKTFLDAQTEHRINSDFRPISYLYDFLLWHKIVHGENRLSAAIFSFNQKTFLLILTFGIFLSVLLLSIAKKKKSALLRIRLATAVLGFAGMACNIILLLAFQTLFGYVYTWVGLAMAAYMAGTASAALWATRFIPHKKSRRALLLLFIISIIVLLLMIPTMRLISSLNAPFLFMLLFIVAGALVGAAFPILCRLYAEFSKQPEVGSIYAADVLGGALGAFLLSSFFVPFFGFFNTVLITAMFCVMGFVFVLRGH